jgi:bifunctional ADP-heptose synthase (sugar kinase/adenylyltransferase)
MDELADFAAALSEALEVDGAGVDVARVLSLASDAAHAYVRPAAPLATFLAGVAAGRAGATADAMQTALQRAADFCARPPENLG